MQTLSSAALLEAWERGLGQSLLQRALTLLAAACPDTGFNRLATLSIGQRDSLLLTLRELTFGPTLSGVVQCRRCRAQLELAFNTEDTRATSPADGHDRADPDTFTVTVGDDEVRYRLPNSLDLAGVLGEPSIDRARGLLLRRCLLAVTHAGADVPIDGAPPQLLDMAATHMARVDPQGDVQVAFTCPSCGHQREVAFDIASFFWGELNAWASRTLSEVHTLAAAYGWPEADILAMSPRRRQLYLDLAG